MKAFWIVVLACSQLSAQSSHSGISGRARNSPKSAEVSWWAEAETHRQDLVFALRSRLLTPAEMDEVRRDGYRIYLPIVPPGEVSWGYSYREGELEQRFRDDLLQQLQIRIALLEAKQGCGK